MTVVSLRRLRYMGMTADNRKSTSGITYFGIFYFYKTDLDTANI